MTTYDARVQRAYEALASEAGLDCEATGSVAGAIVRALLREVDDVDALRTTAMTALSLYDATGTELDAIGELLGVTRKTTYAGISSLVGVRFATSQPVTAAITIPRGTQVWQDGAPDIYFLTLTATTIPVGGTEAYTALYAPEPGLVSAAPYTLTRHNADTPVSVTCANTESLAGADREDDESYRYRLGLARQALNGASLSALRSAFLSYPGVLDATVLSARRGAGTVDVIVQTIEPIPSALTLAALSAYAREVIADGISIRVSGPTILRVSLTLQATFLATASATERELARTTIAAALRGYLNTRDIGETVTPRGLRDAGLRSVSGIDLAILAITVDGASHGVVPITVGSLARVVADQVDVV